MDHGRLAKQIAGDGTKNFCGGGQVLINLGSYTAPWLNSSGANMSGVMGKVQLPARMAIPRKVCNALIDDRA